MRYVNGTKFNHNGEKMILECGEYFNHRVAILVLYDNRKVYSKITVNLPDDKLNDDEIFIKTWSENESIVKSVFKTGLFIDTGKRIPTGFVNAHVWKLVKNVSFNK